jgi:hypothetical protein
MKTLMHLLNKQITIKITPEKFLEGILIDVGNDILVLFDGQSYLYVPLLHVHKIKLSDKTNGEISVPTGFSLSEHVESISYRSILTNLKAKGLFTEIYVVGNQSLHGHVTNVLSDYFVFYSPVYKTIYISLSHLKLLTLKIQNANPYAQMPISNPPGNLPRSWEGQLKTFEGNLVVFDMGEDQDKIGLLKNVENNLIELATGSGETMYLTLNHIKSFYTT